MISMPFEYTRATSLDDALAKLRAANGDGKLIAGGHSLVPLMKLRLSEPASLIDIARIPGLSGITASGDEIEIGAGTVHHDVAASALLRDVCPMLAEAAAEIGDPQVRNRGTLGGSLAHADPAADYPAVMLALDAEIQIKGAGRRATVKAQRLLPGPVHRRPGGRTKSSPACSSRRSRAAAYAKLHQRASHFAIVGVAAALEVTSGVVQSARIGLTGASSHRDAADRSRAELDWREARPRTRSRRPRGDAGADLEDVNCDLHASEEYRRAMIPVFTKRALTAALERVPVGILARLSPSRRKHLAARPVAVELQTRSLDEKVGLPRTPQLIGLILVESCATKSPCPLREDDAWPFLRRRAAPFLRSAAAPAARAMIPSASRTLSSCRRAIQRAS